MLQYSAINMCSNMKISLTKEYLYHLKETPKLT